MNRYLWNNILVVTQTFIFQLASSVERPAADGEEAGNVDMNGHGEAAHEATAQKEIAEDWRDKFEVLHMEHEKMYVSGVEVLVFYLMFFLFL